MATKADLKKHQGEGAMLFCVECQAEYSANYDDYFQLSDFYEFTCCDEPCDLVVKRTTYTSLLSAQHPAS